VLRGDKVAAAVVGLASVAGAVALVWGKGWHGHLKAANAARVALAGIGYEPLGPPEVVAIAEQEVAWALERARPGPVGTQLAAAEAGAFRYRVTFPAGGEVEVTEGGLPWSVRRPSPARPGAVVFPLVATARTEERLRELVNDPQLWRLVSVQGWREGDASWQRSSFVGVGGTLPSGWRRELEVEALGSSVVSYRRRVLPDGIDLGVVKGRMAELATLRQPAQLGLVLLAFAAVVAVAEAFAYHERLMLGRSLLLGALVATIAVFLGGDSATAAAQGAVVALAVAALPAWPVLPPTRFRWAPAAGVAAAVVVLGGRQLVLHLGGWTPVSPPAAGEHGALVLLAGALLPALAEEPLLRGVLPGITAPYLGWWGAMLIGVPVGAALHALPAVPLAASLAVEIALQLAMVITARWYGVGGAVVARAVSEAVVRRPSFPAGLGIDILLIGVIVLGAVLLLWRGRPVRD
jgi:energy-converting hydrogenase Eha subunit A